MNFKKLNHKDVLVRTLKTALVSFLSAWAITNYNFSTAALVSAGSAAGTAVLNYALQVAQG